MKEEIYRFNQKSENRELIRFSICGITFPDKSYFIKRPNSRTACIEYVEEGRGTVHIDKTTFSPVGGDSYFLQTGKDQYYYSDKKEPWKKYFINFSGKLADSLAEGYGISDVSHFEGLDLRDELLRIIELGKTASEDCTPQLIAILNEVFLKMREHSKKKGEQSSIEIKMKDFLDTQVTSKFQISLLCKHISHSESQTIRIFKKTYGITPYAYLLKKKIDFSKNLLRDTNLSVKEIAEKLCFADEYYFSNLFKSKVGVSPAVYRREQASKQN